MALRDELIRQGVSDTAARAMLRAYLLSGPPRRIDRDAAASAFRRTDDQLHRLSTATQRADPSSSVGRVEGQLERSRLQPEIQDHPQVPTVAPPTQTPLPIPQLNPPRAPQEGMCIVLCSLFETHFCIACVYM